MAVLLLLSAGVFAAILLIGVAKARVRIHGANVAGALRDLDFDRERKPAWHANYDQTKTFRDVLVKAASRQGIPYNYVRILTSPGQGWDTVLAFAAHMEERGSGFVAQQEGTSQLVSIMWSRLESKDKRLFINS